jgi:predicted DNA-binding transcriptional regulator YafY
VPRLGLAPGGAEVLLGRPDDPFALNLARIVHRLITSPRGWQVARLKEELGIADRTYRKYRRTIQEQFAPLRDRRGRSVVREVRDGEAVFLRLVEGGVIDVESPDLVSSMAALHLARQAFQFLGETELKTALDDLQANLRERVGDKRFVLGHLFRNYAEPRIMRSRPLETPVGCGRARLTAPHKN